MGVDGGAGKQKKQWIFWMSFCNEAYDFMHVTMHLWFNVSLYDFANVLFANLSSVCCQVRCI